MISCWPHHDPIMHSSWSHHHLIMIPSWTHHGPIIISSWAHHGLMMLIRIVMGCYDCLSDQGCSAWSPLGMASLCRCSGSGWGCQIVICKCRPWGRKTRERRRKKRRKSTWAILSTFFYSWVLYKKLGWTCYDVHGFLVCVKPTMYFGTSNHLGCWGCSEPISGSSSSKGLVDLLKGGSTLSMDQTDGLFL